jgi:hypothetical protein
MIVLGRITMSYGCLSPMFAGELWVSPTWHYDFFGAPSSNYMELLWNLEHHLQCSIGDDLSQDLGDV